MIAKHINGKVDTHWMRGGGMKDAGMRIKVEQKIRKDFIAACQSDHIPAAQVLRQFMRDFIQIKKNNVKAIERKNFLQKK